MTNLEAKQHLARKLNIDYSDIANNDLWSETDLQTLIQFAVIKAWDYRPWDFSEGSKTGTTVSTEYYDYPTDLQTGSAYLLRVNGEEYKKLLFQDYLRFFEENPTATDKFWSEQKRFVFINANAYTVGQSFDVFGKLMPPVVSSSGDLLPFSPDADNYEHSGNEAIVQLAYAEALDSEKKKEYTQAEAERKKAYQTLELLWKPFAEARASLQSIRPMFNVPDLMKSNKNASQYVGNFDYLR